MDKRNCEKVRLSAMAIQDGEVPQVSTKEIDEHLEFCADCCHELKQQKEAIGWLDGQSRRIITEDIYSRIIVSIDQSQAKPRYRQELCLFLVLGLILFAYKVLEVLPAFTPDLFVKLMPLAFVFLFFCLLKQNPFKINKNLKLEGDLG